MRTLPAPPLDERMKELRRLIGDESDGEMSIHEYAVMHWLCEVRPYLDTQLIGECRGRGNPHLLEIHHIAGRGKYGETAGNWISVSQPVHSWITDHSKPGLILAAYAKWKKDEHNWGLWSSLKPTYRLSWLETDDCIAACKPWPVIEKYRIELLENA